MANLVRSAGNGKLGFYSQWDGELSVVCRKWQTGITANGMANLVWSARIGKLGFNTARSIRIEQNYRKVMGTKLGIETA